MSKKAKLTPEQQLAIYWRRRIKLAESRFDKLYDSLGGTKTTAFEQIINRIAQAIMQGEPLNRLDYHIAVGQCYLMGETPYEEFYKHHWHETAGHYGYGKPADCYYCKRERQEKRDRIQKPDGY